MDLFCFNSLNEAVQMHTQPQITCFSQVSESCGCCMSEFKSDSKKIDNSNKTGIENKLNCN